MYPFCLSSQEHHLRLCGWYIYQLQLAIFIYSSNRKMCTTIYVNLSRPDWEVLTRASLVGEAPLFFEWKSWHALHRKAFDFRFTYFVLGNSGLFPIEAEAILQLLATKAVTPRQFNLCSFCNDNQLYCLLVWEIKSDWCSGSSSFWNSIFVSKIFEQAW